jgi:hypothetical protein
MMAYGDTPKGKLTGSPNKKSIGASARKFARTLNPWGFNVPKRGVPKGVSSPGGSSMRKPIPDPQLKGMDYPANDPLLWPVEIDKVNHTRQPSSSGINAAVIAKNNAAVEQAYHRAGYQ